MPFDAEKFLNTQMFALDQLGVFSNVADFLIFSEDNIAHQKTAALQRVEKDVANAGLEEPEVCSYREHLKSLTLDSSRCFPGVRFAPSGLRLCLRERLVARMERSAIRDLSIRER